MTHPETPCTGTERREDKAAAIAKKFYFTLSSLSLFPPLQKKKRTKRKK